MALLFAPPFYRATDLSNAPIPGAFIGFFKTLTSELQPIYADAGLTVSLANPLPSDGNGVFPAIWLDDALPPYKFVIYAPDQNDITVPGAVLRTGDPYTAPLNLAALITQINPLLNAATPAELIIGATLNYAYLPGDVRRYGAKCDNATDDTASLNVAASVARQAYINGGGPNYIQFLGPGPCKVSGPLNFSTIDVYGYGEWKHIQATSDQFDIITSTGSTKLIGLRVDGGWNGSTAGLSGDTVSFKAVSPAHPYNNNIHNCTFINNKKHGVYIERGGYTSFTGTNVILTCGLHAVECAGIAGDMCTTITTAGTNQWGGCVNGYGIKLTECAKMTFRDVITENTQGYQINGIDNRAITFDGCYQENFHGENTTGFFIVDNGAGVGLVVRSCFGGNLALPDFTNWQDVYLSGNSNLAESAVPVANRILEVDGGELTTSTTGGVNVTAASVSMPIGTWLIWGTVQTAASTASTLTQTACCLTTNVASSGLANSTSAFVVGADEATYNPGVGMDQRLHCFQRFRFTAVTTLYLRTRLVFSGAGNLAYRGYITAVKFQ